MLMQTFVENAILHGINPNRKHGFIIIDFDIKNESSLLKLKIMQMVYLLLQNRPLTNCYQLKLVKNDYHI